MGIKDILGNDIIKAGTFGAGVEGVNMIAQNALGIGEPAFGEAFGDVKGAVDSILDITGANSLMAANVGVTSALSGLGAGLLSNKVLKDLGLNDEGAGIGSTKNFIRYGLNTGAMLGAYSAGTAAAPYLLAGAGAYFIGKHGWKFGKELTKRGLGTAWGLTGGLVKGAITGAGKGVKAGIKGNQKINPVT